MKNCIFCLFCLLSLPLTFLCSHETSRPIRIPISDNVSSLDPRLARDLTSQNIVQLLFSGLTKLTPEGATIFELAEKITPAPNGTKYTITLKKAFWSDHTPITSQDFIYSWKTILEKKRGCPNAYFLFWIKNAKSIYDTVLSQESLGTNIISDTQFEVELEHPCPFFLQLLATTPYIPVQKQYDQKIGYYDEEHAFPISGTFQLTSWMPNKEISFAKNTHYWNSKYSTQKNISMRICNELSSRYNTVNFPVVDDSTAVIMLEAKQVEWAGSPLGTLPSDLISIFKEKKQMYSTPAAGTYFLRINVKRLQDSRLRRALSLVIDKEALTEHVTQGGQLPATTFVPPKMLLLSQEYSSKNRVEQAKTLLKEYCADKKCSPKAIHIHLAFAANELSLKISQALQQNISNVLGITVDLSPADSKHLYTQVANLDYDIALRSWFSDYFDPHGFYSVFEYANNGTNNTGWESIQYQQLLRESSNTFDEKERQHCFCELEKILAQEAPIVPLFHACFNYLKEPSIDGISISPLGYLNIE